MELLDSTLMSAGLSFAAGGLIVLFVLITWKRLAWYREPRWVKNSPIVPEPTWVSMITGVVLEYVRKGNICRTFMHPDQPDILRFPNGIAGGMFRDVILCKSPKMVKEILEEKDTAKPERGYRAFRRLTGYKGNYDFLSAHSHKDPLYARTRIPAYETLMKRTLNNYDTLFLDIVKKLIGRIEGGSENVNVVDEMHHVATSLITSIAFNEQSEKMDFALFESAVWIINDMIARPQNNSMPLLDALPTPRNYQLKRRQQTLINTIESMIANKKRNPGDDVISVLLQNKENTDNDLLGVLSIFFFAGFDTTSNTMAMVLYHLAHNQDVQEKARANVFEVIGRTAKPKLHKLYHMQYLLAVIKETLRLFPTVPMITREVTDQHDDGVCPRFKEETTFGVLLNLFGLHYNPKAWNKPNEFIPERWIDASIDEGVDLEERVYAPFALGKRACLGRQFAYFEMLTVISMILQRFRLSPTDGHDQLEILEGGTLVVKNNLRLNFKPYDANEKVSPKSGPSAVEKEYSLDEVSKHHTAEDCWVIVDGGVYDITAYAARTGKNGHPGGSEILIAYGGADVTAEFDFISHSKFARRLLGRYRIGRLRNPKQLLSKEDRSKHILGEDIAKGRRRTTMPVQNKSFDNPSPLRNSQVIQS